MPKKAVFTAFTAILMISAVSCSGPSKRNQNTTVELPVYSDIVLGQDYTDLSAKLTVLTNRTDLIQDKADTREFPDYIAEFNELYPNISIMYTGIADYDSDMSDRIKSNGWGDICCIPSTVRAEQLTEYFEPFGNVDSLSDNYEFISDCVYDNIVYGIPSAGNVQGIVYNKRIWSEAGITETPTEPDEFLADLKLIAENTNAIPLYTNYAARWPLVTWDTFLFTTATGDPRYKYDVLPYEKSPFAKGTGAYEIYNIIWSAVKDGLTEPDPTKTSWELCKAKINNGEIATMALGSWAVTQMQEAGENPQDIGYMPFPISVNGTQFAQAGSDYCYGINKNISDEKKLAAMIYVKYLTEESGYAADQGCIPVVKGEDYPEVFESFSQAELIAGEAVSDSDAELYQNVNTNSGLLLESDPTHIARLIDSALSGSEEFDDIINEWNKNWAEATVPKGDEPQ